MAKGPSPLIPLLLVLTLGLLLHGETMMGSFSFALEAAEDTSIFTIFLIIPVLTILIIYHTTQTIILPAVTVVLVMYLVITKMLLGPLFLIFLVCLAAVLGSSSSSSLQWQFSYRSAARIRDGDEFGGLGWVLILLLVVLLAVHGVFSLAEGNEWAFAFLAVLVFVAYNFSND